jgi:hypothetical protein
LRRAVGRDLFVNNENNRANQSQKGKAAAMKINRRIFLKQSAVGATGVLLGSQLAGRAAEAAASVPMYHDPFAPVNLGKTGMKWSRLCIGTGMKGGNRESNQTRMGKEKFTELLRV